MTLHGDRHLAAATCLNDPYNPLHLPVQLSWKPVIKKKKINTKQKQNKFIKSTEGNKYPYKVDPVTNLQINICKN